VTDAAGCERVTQLFKWWFVAKRSICSTQLHERLLSGVCLVDLQWIANRAHDCILKRDHMNIPLEYDLQNFKLIVYLRWLSF